MSISTPRARCGKCSSCKHLAATREIMKTTFNGCPADSLNRTDAERNRMVEMYNDAMGTPCERVELKH